MVKKKRKTRNYGNCSRDRPDSLCCLEITTNNSHLSLHVCFSLHKLAPCIPPSSPDHDFSTFLDPPMQSSFYVDLFALAEVEAEIKVIPVSWFGTVFHFLSKHLKKINLKEN